MNARQGFIDFLLFYFTNFFNKELQTAWKDNMILNFNSTYEYEQELKLLRRLVTESLIHSRHTSTIACAFATRG